LSLSLSLSSIAGIQALEIANAGKFLRKVSGCANGFIICYFLRGGNKAGRSSRVEACL
jgi:hypothetical protein